MLDDEGQYERVFSYKRFRSFELTLLRGAIKSHDLDAPLPWGIFFSGLSFQNRPE